YSSSSNPPTIAGDSESIKSQITDKFFGKPYAKDLAFQRLKLRFYEYSGGKVLTLKVDDYTYSGISGFSISPLRLVPEPRKILGRGNSMLERAASRYPEYLTTSRWWDIPKGLSREFDHEKFYMDAIVYYDISQSLV
ncbi:hypothetical protein, partial [Pseudomonas asplenii]|uniref:hypothetical protein n=1 Tax=Pseudomonas asplenii TaxID=53407 RepID=UPI001E62B1A2